MEPTGHAADEELEQYSLGGIAEEECARIEEHLLICQDCRDRLEEYDLIAGSIAFAAERWRAERSAPDKKTWRFPRLFFVFACIALMGLGALWFLRNNGRNPSPIAVTLTATRGTPNGAQARAGRPLDLHPDLTGLAVFPQYDLQVVDSSDHELARRKAVADVATQVPALRRGTYFVRIYSPGRELLREYALQVMQ